MFNFFGKKKKEEPKPKPIDLNITSINLSNKMNDIAKTVNTEKAIYGKDVEEAERVINDLGEFVRNGIIPLPLREVEF